MAGRSRGRARRLLLLYVALLVASTVVRFARGPRPIDESLERDDVAVFDHGAPTGERAPLAYQEFRGDAGIPVVFLHGSPGGWSDLRGVAEELVLDRRMFLVDLPGFGASRGAWPDLSIDAQARSMEDWAAARGLDRVHLVGFSMGGGVALEWSQHAPDRVASLTMLAAIGVQELELFGGYKLNHMVHSGQLWLLRALRWFTPHFGVLDDSMFGEAYARQFHESDQRPLRAALRAWDGPALVIHGERDVLVPAEAAREHLRLLPQARDAWIDANHFRPFLQTEEVAALLERFLDDVEAGVAPTRADADPARVAASLEPWNPDWAPPFRGMRLVALLALLALATLVSEDLACIAAGLLVSGGRIEFVPATVACFTGILVGDMGLYGLGRALGRPALARAPLRWFVTESAVERGARWFEQRGVRVVFLSRFLPGLRLPTYVAAGVVRASFPRFALAFVVACAIWTPLLVGIAAWFGGSLEGVADRLGGAAPWAFVVLLVGIFALERLVVPLFSHRGRRLLRARIERRRRWEFWPRWAFYPPIVWHIAKGMIRRRSIRLLSATNPAMPAGGLAGERKSEILDGLGGGGGFVARHVLLSGDRSVEDRLSDARAFLASIASDFPVVLKPNVGERGSGVVVVRDEDRLRRELEERDQDQILQEYAPGLEFGVFVLKRPGEDRFRLHSVARKVMPVIVGDGERTLERLVLDDDRAVCLFDHYMDANVDRWLDVPAAGERVQLVELGTHCRGAIFLDGSDLATDALRDRFDAISRGYDGFFFGRYDVRAVSEAALTEGRDLLVVEVNGLSSEPAHLYDPKFRLSEARASFRATWDEAFAIAAANHAAGAPLVGWRELWRQLRGPRG